MASVQFRPNPLLEAELKTSGVLLLELEAKAHEVAHTAEELGRQIGRSGHGYKVEVTRGGEGGIRLEASSRGINPASWIEFGTATLPAAAPLRRAAEGAGLKLTDGKP